MRIERDKTFRFHETIWRENILVPVNERDETTQEFIRYYQTGNLDDLAGKTTRQELDITIALCILEEKESWRNIAMTLKADGWSGASLLLWKLYVQDRKEALSENVILPGMRYRDDDIIEWVPVVHHRPIVSLLGTLRGSETRVSMKPSSILTIAKPHTVLISKFKKSKD